MLVHIKNTYFSAIVVFDYILPTTGRIPDLHRLETCAAGRTTKSVPPGNSCGADFTRSVQGCGGIEKKADLCIMFLAKVTHFAS